jgi:hypothetical protein
MQGQYVSGLDANALRISVFAGDVTLKNLHLKPEALVKLNLPVTVKGGLLGSLKLKVHIAIARAGLLDAAIQSDSLLYIFLSPICCKFCTGSFTCTSHATLQIPWRSLGQSPVIVEIDSVFLLACPKTEVDSVSDTAIKVTVSKNLSQNLDLAATIFY